MNNFAALMNQLTVVCNPINPEIQQIESVMTILKNAMYHQMKLMGAEEGFKSDQEVEEFFDTLENSCRRIRILLKRRSESPENFVSMEDLIGK